MILGPGWKNGQGCQQQQPQHIHPVDLGMLCFRHSSAGKQYAGSGRTAPGVVIFRSVTRTTKSARTPHANPITPRRVSVHASASRVSAQERETAVGVAEEEVQLASARATG